MAITFNPGLLGSSPTIQAGTGSFSGALPGVDTGEAAFQERLRGAQFQVPLQQQAAEFLSPQIGQRAQGDQASLAQGTAALRAQLRQSIAGVTEGFGQAREELAAADLAAQIGAREFLEGSQDIASLDPFVQAGQEATERLNALSGLSGAEAQEEALAALQASPEFQFRLEQGTKALQQSAAAKGLLGSGRFAQELTQFAQGLAQEAIGEQTQRLESLSNLGLISAQEKARIATGLEQQQQQLSTALEQQRATLASEEAIRLADIRSGFTGQIAALEQQLTLAREEFDIEREKLASQERLAQASLAGQQLTSLTNTRAGIASQLAQIPSFSSGDLLYAQREAERSPLVAQLTDIDRQIESLRSTFNI
jgi:hypothetical protein